MSIKHKIDYVKGWLTDQIGKVNYSTSDFTIRTIKRQATDENLAYFRNN